MVLIIDNRPLFERAKELSDSISKFYVYLNNSKDKGVNETISGILKRNCYEAFKLNYFVREQTQGLNDRLKLMLEKGYLELSDDEISIIDPVTKEYCFEKLGQEIFQGIDN
ncbi:MAG: hypothetical protein JSV92_04525 [archaeon]|nr:MAG: hypothetical protein JSV92_04525 [archaeon]